MADTLSDLYTRWCSAKSDAALDDLLTATRQTAMRMSRHDEDVAQNALVVICSKLATFNPNDAAKFAWWVRSIIARTAKGTIRGQIRRREDQHSEEHDYQPNDETQYRNFSEIPDNLREITVLLTEGYSVSEVAEFLGVRPDSISKKVRRACPKYAA